MKLCWDERMFLPNGTHIYFKYPTLEGIERLRGMIERGETITCTSIDLNGIVTTRVLWHRTIRFFRGQTSRRKATSYESRLMSGRNA